MIKNHIKYLIAIALALLAAGVFAFFSKPPEIKNLPPPKTYEEISPALVPTPVAVNPLLSLPAEINLAIPFTSQAPHKNWEDPYQEFCEEASVLMASHYIRNKDIPNPEYADAEMLKIKHWQEQRFGYYKDTTAVETAIILKEYYLINKVEVVYNPTINQIKEAVATGKAVIIPAAGRQLPNPNFRQPGPLYHMLVVKGYTSDGKIITNDPGTRLGADFIYDPEPLMNAMHDWNNGDVENGQKVMIIVG